MHDYLKSSEFALRSLFVLTILPLFLGNHIIILVPSYILSSGSLEKLMAHNKNNKIKKIFKLIFLSFSVNFLEVRYTVMPVR